MLDFNFATYSKFRIFFFKIVFVKFDIFVE